MAEVTIEDEIRVDCSAASVWEALVDPAAHASWHPFLTEIDGKHRLGEARKCAVVIGGKPSTTSERCVEADERRALAWAIEEDTSGFSRMVNDWRSGFRLEESNGATVVTAWSAFRPSSFAARLMLPLIRRKFHQTQRTILTGLRSALEKRRPQSPAA